MGVVANSCQFLFHSFKFKCKQRTARSANKQQSKGKANNSECGKYSKYIQSQAAAGPPAMCEPLGDHHATASGCYPPLTLFRHTMYFLKSKF